MARIPTVEIVVDGRRKIVNADDPRANPQPSQTPAPSNPSKSDIAGMKKVECVEWLEAHGIDDPKGSVADLRKQLAAIIYVG